ncbi:MFS transporter [Actinoplanes couchii]|uniref:MFS transporter n=1 Tax=Actinoplanes couchii TaxID=403638 RepID=A0ABQ3XP06_9ACTN|nr:MFS transporter [Actinoplanes couchii]MDR6318609.1 MFS family permease [Actinoplanes couchii]GID60218.1 MFS transporter [Actinoplanes couchii]
MNAVVPPPRIPRTFLVTYALASFGLWMAMLPPMIVSLPLKISAVDPDAQSQGSSLSIVLGVGAVFGILANPIVGRISDRTTWRAGMRRPWLLIGALLSAAGAVIIAVSDSLAGVTAGWSLNQIGLNATMSVLLTLIPDQVAPERRGVMSGVTGLTQALAAMAGVGLVAGLSQVSLAAALVVPCVVALVLVTVAAGVLRDRRLDRADRPPFDPAAFARSFWVSPRRFPDFGWAWISRFAIFMAISLVLNYQVFYLTSHLGLTEADATALIPAATAVQTVMVVIASITLGPMSDRVRRRKVFVIVAALIATGGLTILALAPPSASSTGLFLVAMALVGLGQGAYFAVDTALVLDVLPDKDRDAGKDLGVIGMANLIPQSVAPAVAPAFLTVPVLSATGLAGQNYTALYLAGVLFAIVAAATILPIRGVR